MKKEMVMPQMGESIAEATILKWHKSVGDAVSQDETILEISTDKVDSEIPAPVTGVLVEVKAEEGETVPVKSVIAIIETDKAAADESTGENTGEKSAAPTPPAKTPEPASPPATPSSPPPPAQELQPVGASPSELPAHIGQRFYSPLVRSLAAQHGLSPNELGNIPGTGAHGRVTKVDVLNYMQFRGAGTAATAAPKNPLPPQAPRPDYGPDGTRIEPMDRMRKLIAEHMVRSKATSPHVYSVAEIDMTNVSLCRKNNQAAFQKREGVKLSYTVFFLEAAIRALMQYPQVNASVDGDNVILKRDVHLGCAVAIGTSGLIVPVIKNADQLNLGGIARKLDDLAKRARSKELQPDEIQGGTFTVTNAGVFGSIMGLPIISQPQLAILSVGAIKKRPVVVDDMIGIRDMVYLTLSYDHRVIDGSLAGQFLAYVTKWLENVSPDRTV